MDMNQPMRPPGGGDPLADPSVAEFAEQHTQQVNEMAQSELTPPEPPTPQLEVLHVDLPVGLDHPQRGRITTAEVRELNGEDEEYFLKGRELWHRQTRLLERGVLTLGGEKPDTQTLRALAQADRLTLMHHIRRATYGDELRLGITCTACGEDQRILIDLAKEVDIKEAKPTFEVELRKGGSAVGRWPTGEDEEAVMGLVTQGNDVNIGEVNTKMLGRILETVNGEPAMADVTALQMNMGDRQRVIDHLTENMPGPDYALDYACSKCRRSARLEVSFGDLFR